MVGILEYGLAKVADLMIKYVIIPFINRGQPLSFIEESNQDSAVLKIVSRPDSKVVSLFVVQMPCILLQYPPLIRFITLHFTF